jgi:tetratricopeptide (TPR) repeat protein
MKYAVKRGMLLLLGLVILSSCSEKETATEIQWASSLQEAFQLAEEKSQPIIAEFWMDECKWCERLEDSTFTHPSVIDLSKSMVFVKAEGKKDTVTKERFQLAGFPTVIVMNSAGKEIDRIYGYLPPDEFVTTVKDYLQGKNTLEDLEGRYETESDAELAFRLAEKYEGRRRYEEAAKYYNKVLDLDPKNEKGHSEDALFNVAWVKLRGEDPQGAVDAFKYFLQKFPQSEMAIVAERYVPFSYAEAGDTSQALKLYEKFLKDHPDSPDTGWVKDQISKLKGEVTEEKD